MPCLYGRHIGVDLGTRPIPFPSQLAGGGGLQSRDEEIWKNVCKTLVLIQNLLTLCLTLQLVLLCT